MTGMNRSLNPIRRVQLHAPVLAILLAASSVNQANAGPGGAAHDARPAIDTSTCSRPVYPEEDARQKNTGTVTMQFLIGPDGYVLESKIQKSSGYASLDEAARSALVNCRFKPPMAEGRPVRAWTAVQYVWTPD